MKATEAGTQPMKAINVGTQLMNATSNPSEVHDLATLSVSASMLYVYAFPWFLLRNTCKIVDSNTFCGLSSSVYFSILMFIETIKSLNFKLFILILLSEKILKFFIGLWFWEPTRGKFPPPWLSNQLGDPSPWYPVFGWKPVGKVGKKKHFHYFPSFFLSSCPFVTLVS